MSIISAIIRRESSSLSLSRARALYLSQPFVVVQPSRTPSPKAAAGPLNAYQVMVADFVFNLVWGQLLD